MDTTLEFAEALSAQTPPRPKRTKTAPQVIAPLEKFFPDPPTEEAAPVVEAVTSELPPSPVKPPLPPHLERFAWVHHIAAKGKMPVDKAAEVMAAVNEAADHKGLRCESAIEELEELEEWLQAWMLERVEIAEPDPYAPCDRCNRTIGEAAEGCSGKHLD